MRDLKSFVFTTRSDIASSADGWWVYALDVVTAMDGNDTIQTIANGTVGDGPIIIEGTLDLGNGNDALIGLCNENIWAFNDGIRIEEGGQLLTGAGYDKIIGRGGDFGIINHGTILTGLANDLISTDGGYSRNGIRNQVSGQIDTGSGDDIIRAVGRESVGLVNLGSIATGEGKDQILGGEGQTTREGIYNSSMIHTGAHNDLISASGMASGIFNESGGFINAGAGNDTINATGDESGVDNKGILYFGSGDDVIRGTSVQYALANSGTIDMDTGRDQLWATASSPGSSMPVLNNQLGGVISLGDGGDGIYVNSRNSSIGLLNQGLIDTGLGDSVIEVIGGKSFGIVNHADAIISNGSGSDFIGITQGGLFVNDGLVTCGAGRDVVTSFWGGFSGDGTIDMGPGDDDLQGIAIKSSAKALFKGGSGMDELNFKSGTYSVLDQGGGRYLIGGTMNVIGFERFGSAAFFLDIPTAAAQGYVVFR